MSGVFLYGFNLMPVNILNLPGLTVLDFKETDVEYHVKASPIEIIRCCPHCSSSNDIVSHAWRTLVTRDMPSHCKAVAIHLDVPRLKCRSCNKTFTLHPSLNLHCLRALQTNWSFKLVKRDTLHLVALGDNRISTVCFCPK